ncbi:hypothetical protein BX600DRAFT_516350 [Xylariales sp. PMI_506]|nr:hypothetical protein BX600DRAFT_516350 [Xylariales sp. PMI_506]
MDKDEQAQPLTLHIEDFEDDFESLESLSSPRSQPWERSWFICASFVLSILAAGCFGAQLERWRVDLDHSCAAHTTQFSPILDDVDIKYSMTSFDGRFMNESIYRRPGSPEVDAAWEALGVDYRAGIISEEAGLRSGLTHHHVQRSKKYGGGFMVNVEGLHHLHCLNLVRKTLYFNYDYYKSLGGHAFLNDGEPFRMHVTHCLDTVRQALMCNADTGVLGQVWVDPTSPQAFPDFLTQHKCKNFEDIRRWGEIHQAPSDDETPRDYLAHPKSEDFLSAIP